MSYIHTLLDFILHIKISDLVANYGGWTYGILFAILFCETGLVVTPFLPGDSLLFMAGVVAHSGAGLNIHLVVLLMLIAAVLGDAVNYAIGHFFGEKLFSNPNAKIFKRKHLERTQAFYEHHGGKTIILARFVPIVRTFAPFVAGMSGMHYRRFFLYNVIGAVMWVFLLTYAGYFFGGISWVEKNLELVVIGIVIVSVLPAVVEVLRHRFGHRTQTDVD